MCHMCYMSGHGCVTCRVMCYMPYIGKSFTVRAIEQEVPRLHVLRLMRGFKSHTMQTRAENKKVFPRLGRCTHGVSEGYPIALQVHP